MGLLDTLHRAASSLGLTSRYPRTEPPPDQLRSIPEVVDRLRAVVEPLPANDGVSCFARTYLHVTELVGEQVQEGVFDDTAFMERFDVVFAGLFLDAVECPDVTRSKAWAPLFEGRATGGVEEIQFALARMNAHINHDLSVALVRTCRQLGKVPDAGIERDYVRVNQLLADSVEEGRQSYLSGPARALDERAAPVLNLVGSWSIERARDAAWHSARVQWRLQRSESLYADFVRTQEASVGLVTRQLLTPLGVPA